MLEEKLNNANEINVAYDEVEVSLHILLSDTLDFPVNILIIKVNFLLVGDQNSSLSDKTSCPD